MGDEAVDLVTHLLCNGTCCSHREQNRGLKSIGGYGDMTLNVNSAVDPRHYDFLFGKWLVIPPSNDKNPNFVFERCLPVKSLFM